MSRRVSFWGGLSLALLTLGGCLLADVGINPDLEEEPGVVMNPALGGGSGNGSQSNGSGGGSGSASTAAGSGGLAGDAGSSSIPEPPATGGSASSGAAGTGASGSGGSAAGAGNAAAGAGGSGGLTAGELAALRCPDNVDLETACAQYCDVYAEACSDFTPAQGGPYDYLNTTDCATFCYSSGWAVGTNSTVDSVKCRCFHSVLKIVENAATPHCFHAARVPTMGGCQPPN